MSSYLSKSKKDFKPKAPLRRAGAQNPSSQPAFRSSADPQPQRRSQTPQTRPNEFPDRQPQNHATPVYENDNEAAGVGRAPRDAPVAPEAPCTSRDGHSLPESQKDAAPANQSQHPNSTIVQSCSAQPENVAPAAESPVRQLAESYNRPRLSVPKGVGLEISHSSNYAEIQPVPVPLGLPHTIQVQAEPPTKRRKLHNQPVELSENFPASSSATQNQSATRSAIRSDRDIAAVSDANGAKPQAKTSKKKRGKAAENRCDPEIIAARKAKRIARLQKVADSIVAEAVEGSVSEEPARRTWRGKRARTPLEVGGAEDAPSGMRMADLCRDSNGGKKSTREERLEEREKTQKAAKAREQLKNLMSPSETASRSQERSVSEEGRATASSPRRRHSPMAAAALAPQVRLVNGQIVQDESSRVFDRHAAVDQGYDSNDDVQEEDDLTKRINSASYQKKLPPFRWTAELTEQFYEGLRQFGTDFNMMSTLFPGLSRRQLKLKFVKEERTNEEQVKHVLLHEQKLPDPEELQRLANIVYRDPSEIEKELEEDLKRLEEQYRVDEESVDQVERNREDDVDSEAREDGEEKRSSEAESDGAATYSGNGPQQETEDSGGAIAEGSVQEKEQERTQRAPPTAPQSVGLRGKRSPRRSRRTAATAA